MAVMQPDTLNVIHARAAGLDVHKMQITATVRLARPGRAAETFTEEFSALPDGLKDQLDAFRQAAERINAYDEAIRRGLGRALPGQQRKRGQAASGPGPQGQHGAARRVGPQGRLEETRLKRGSGRFYVSVINAVTCLGAPVDAVFHGLHHQPRCVKAEAGHLPGPASLRPWLPPECPPAPSAPQEWP